MKKLVLFLLCSVVNIGLFAQQKFNGEINFIVSKEKEVKKFTLMVNDEWTIIKDETSAKHTFFYNSKNDSLIVLVNDEKPIAYITNYKTLMNTFKTSESSNSLYTTKLKNNFSKTDKTKKEEEITLQQFKSGENIAWCFQTQVSFSKIISLLLLNDLWLDVENQQQIIANDADANNKITIRIRKYSFIGNKEN